MLDISPTNICISILRHASSIILPRSAPLNAVYCAAYSFSSALPPQASPAVGVFEGTISAARLDDRLRG